MVLTPTAELAIPEPAKTVCHPSQHGAIRFKTMVPAAPSGQRRPRCWRWRRVWRFEGVGVAEPMPLKLAPMFPEHTIRRNETSLTLCGQATTFSLRAIRILVRHNV